MSEKIEDLASIMIVTYNRLELTKQTLESIFNTTDIPFEICFVDNYSCDKTVEYLYQFCGDQLNNHPYFRGFKVHKNDKNQGIAVGRNQALKLAEGNWLCTLDNDVELPNHWLADCIKILKQNTDFGSIGVNFENVSYPLITKKELTWQQKMRGNLGTACTVFPKSLHQMIGYFNTEYQMYAHEDADFFFRVKCLNLKLGYLEVAGKHLGEGVNDQGEYRDFKNKYHQANLKKFNENCALYSSGRKSLYVSWKM